MPADGNDEDISTLGDPIGFSSTAGTINRIADDNRSMNTASLDRMLDSTTLFTGHSARMDPGELFDVRVPAGKVGLILEEFPEDGIPIVHGVKPNSPLFGRVKQGDRLYSVDGVDCTGEQAISVAKLLKAREDASSRILTFSRPSQL